MRLCRLIINQLVDLGAHLVLVLKHLPRLGKEEGGGQLTPSYAFGGPGGLSRCTSMLSLTIEDCPWLFWYPEFSQLTSLEELSLIRVPLVYLDDSDWSCLTRVRKINLHNVAFSNIMNDIAGFEALVRLEEFRVSHCVGLRSSLLASTR